MKRIAIAVSCALGLALPGSALAVGGPTPPVQGYSGIGLPGSSIRYVALDAGSRTVLARQRSYRTKTSIRLAGHFGIPGVGFDGSVTGLTADGQTLVLAELPGNVIPVRTTRLIVIDTRSMTVRSRLTLPGWYTVDGVSPDGRWLYLVHYLSRTDVSKYEVRAYSLPDHQLLAKPVIDPRDRGEAMTGFAATRTMGPGDRWAYTFYVRPGGAPFIHALDTVARRAVCIDLPFLAHGDFGDTRLSLSRGGAILDVMSGGVSQASVDMRTFVATPGHAVQAPSHPGLPARRASRSASGSHVPWELVAIAAVLLLTAFALRRERLVN